jgi:hypothetical protein
MSCSDGTCPADRSAGAQIGQVPRTRKQPQRVLPEAKSRDGVAHLQVRPRTRPRPPWRPTGTADEDKVGAIGTPVVELPGEIPFAAVTHTVDGTILVKQFHLIDQSRRIHSGRTRATVETGSLEAMAHTWEVDEPSGTAGGPSREDADFLAQRQCLRPGPQGGSRTGSAARRSDGSDGQARTGGANARGCGQCGSPSGVRSMRALNPPPGQSGPP